MIGLYNAGYVLGLPIDLLTDVMMSPAANALMDIQAGNILYGRPGQLNVTSALRILEGGLNFSYLNTGSMTLIKHVLKGAGIDVTKLNSYSLLSSILPNKYSKSDLYRARKLISLMK